MTRVSARFVYLIPALLAFTLFAFPPDMSGQAIPQFSTVEPHEYDTINLATLGIQLNVPVRTKAGHIPFSIAMTGASQVRLLPGGFSSIPKLAAQEPHIAGTVGNTTDKNCGATGIQSTGFYFTDYLGNTHSFKTINIGSPGCGASTSSGWASDNSGLYMTANYNGGNYQEYIWDASGNELSGPAGDYFTAYTDPNGNAISCSNVQTNVCTDTLNQTVITVTGNPGTSQTSTWTDALGNNQSISLTATPYTNYAAFGCANDAQPATGLKIPTSISFPDGSTMSFTWETTYSNSADYTGRIASIRLPTGGLITYAYSGGTHGINCVDGTPATMTRTTPDGTWTYVHTTGTNPVTTVTDPQGNSTVYTFYSNQEIEKQVYNVGGSLAETVITCYNNPNSTPSSCGSTFGPTVTQKDVYTTYPGVTGYSAIKTTYTTTGLLTEVKTYDFNATTLTSDKQIVYGSGSPSSQTCTALTNHIIDKPCSVTLKDSAGNILSQTWNSYDSKGNLLQTWDLVSGSGSSGTYLSKQYTYDSHGVVQTSTDVNGQVMNYTTTSCNNKFATSQYPTNFTNLQTSQIWDCNGGVATSATDANGQVTQTKFFVSTQTDSFYRPLQKVDELNNVTSFAYTPNSTESIFNFNGGQSTIDALSTTDSIGRPLVSQLLQQPGGSNWDTKSRSFESDGRVYQTSLPCVSTRGAGCPASTESQSYDALNRPLVHTGTGGDVTTKSYPANDVLTVLTPAPNNEHSKSTQKEYDGLGRLKSVCVISSATGSGPCGQTNGGTGFLTTYSYDAAGRLLQVVENAQVSSPRQTRTYTYDKLGRILTETNPEWSGTKSFTYDSVSGANCTSTTNDVGDLVQEVDPNGNTVCHHHDSFHRETYTTYTGPNSNNVSKYFVYDSATVNGIAMANVEGRMAEAYTCAGSSPPPCAPKITDEGFSYDVRGQMSDYYQSSPNSGGYYHLNASHWADRQLNALSGVGLPTITYGGISPFLDGEGRVLNVTASTGTNPVSAVTYNNTNNTEPVGALLIVTLGNGDTQNFTYYQNTGRMQSYSASAGSTPINISGTLTWNANGTLAENNIVDGYNSADTQDCKYLYDDFTRVASGLDATPGVKCMNGPTNVWNQTFSYGSDAFGNLTKTTSGPGTAWAPGYNTSNNHYTLAGTAYDNNGDLTDDTFHTYTWLADGHIATIAQSPHGGTDPTSASATYDALGNKVEENVNGTVHEYVSAFGISAQMSGQTENSTLVNLPGGVQALYSGGTLQRFRFPDWQGTIRAESNPSSRQFTESLAFAPFGERYAVKGAPYNVDSFTGKPDQLVSDEYDFPARQEHNGQGRWISPDPILGPGNKYVYANNNPLTNIDVYGLYAIQINGMQVATAGDEAADIELAESHPPSSTHTGGQSTPTSNQPSTPSSQGTQTPQTQQAQQAQTSQHQSQCGFFCKVGNWFKGDGFKTDEQVTTDHRQWLLDHAQNDADKNKIRHASDEQINNTYACLQDAGCTAQYQRWLQIASTIRFGNNPNQDYHTFRHVEDAGIDKGAAEDAIRADLADKADSLPEGLYKGQVKVGGKVLDYNAFKLPDGTINVGRIVVQ